MCLGIRRREEMEGKSFKLLNLTIHPDNNAMFVEQVPFIRGLGSWQTGIGEGRRYETSKNRCKLKKKEDWVPQ